MAEHRQQQIQVDIEVPSDGKVRLVLETIVGGKGFRTDPGETCLGWIDAQAQEVKLVAWGDSTRWIPYDDQHAIAQLDRTERLLERLDTKRRRKLASSQDVHPIDAFLEEKIHEAVRLDKQMQSQLDEAQQASARWLGDSILPLLASKCGRCHVENRQGGLGLEDIESMLAGGDSGQPAIVPGNPAQSLLIQRVLADSSEERMPPGDQGLKPEEIQSLETWISQGANWIREPLEEDQVRYSPKLDDAKFLRKLTYDLIGLPPTQKELEEYLADPGQDKRLRAIGMRMHRWGIGRTCWPRILR